MTNINDMGLNTLADVTDGSKPAQPEPTVPPVKLGKEIQEDYSKISESVYQLLLELSNKTGNPVTIIRMNQLRVVAHHHAKAIFLAVTGEADRVCAKLRDITVSGLKDVEAQLKRLSSRLDALEHKE